MAAGEHAVLRAQLPHWKDLAYHYAGTTDDPLEQVAARLGFSEPSTFYRAFRRWAGTTPALYRAKRKER